jgi:DNA-binding IclR family transcriptional regulator
LHGYCLGIGDEDKPRYPIESVDNALRLLLQFHKHQSLSVTDAARVIGVSASTAHRLLAMLQYRGFVQQDPATREYVPGGALADLGLAVVGDVDIRARARPFLEHLRDELDETVHLAVLRGNHVLFLDGVETDRPLRAGVITGRLIPAHAVISGKALLATYAPARVRALYPNARIAAADASPPMQRDQLEAELEVIRDQGYATTRAAPPRDHELTELSAVAAVVKGATGAANAAIVVTAPVSRADEAWMARAVQATLRTAESLSQILCASQPA